MENNATNIPFYVLLNCPETIDLKTITRDFRLSKVNAGKYLLCFFRFGIDHKQCQSPMKYSVLTYLSIKTK